MQQNQKDALAPLPKDLSPGGLELLEDDAKGINRLNNTEAGIFLQLARNYLHSFRWHNGLYAQYYGGYVPSLLGVYLFEIVPSKIIKPTPDQFLWVVAGNVPPMYLVVDASPNWTEALASYEDLLADWHDKSKEGLDLSDCFPFLDENPDLTVAKAGHVLAAIRAANTSGST
jgi:hypothetical protein